MTGYGETPHSSELLARLRDELLAESGDGRRLAENPTDNPLCSISYDPAVQCVVITWKRYVTSAQLRFIHETLLDAVRRHGATKVLGDDTALPTIHQDDQRWITEDWMPRAVAAGLRTGASKRPSSHFGEVSVSTLRSGAPKGLTIRSFAKIDDARRWLANAD